MDLPIVGEVSIPDIIFAAYLLFALITGLVRGLGGELRWLLGALGALLLSLNPTVHNGAAGLLTFLSTEAAQATAYFGVYYLGHFIIHLLLGRTRLAGLQVGGLPFRFLGGVSGLVRAFIDCSMFLVLAAGWRIPWNALYHDSRLADYIVEIWGKIGFLHELGSYFTINKFTNF